MKLHSNVTRFVPDDGFIMDAKKEKKANEEHYDFFFISPGWYLCVSKKNAYCISQYMNKIGCSCYDMRMRCKNKSVCKHLIQFMNLKNLPDTDISNEFRELLEAAGWIGTVLKPPDRPENRQRQKLPNAHDPERKPVPQAAQREKAKKTYVGKTAEQIVQGMDDTELRRNACKGGVAAIAELQRRTAIAEEES